MRSQTHYIRLAGLALLLPLLASPAPGTEYIPRKRVLILDSFGPSPVAVGAAAFRETLERELGEPVDIHHASLDAARFTDPDHEAQLVAFLKARYTGKLDLVAPILMPAAQFVSRQGDLFGTTPVVVAGISLRRIPAGFPPPTATYVAAHLDTVGHVENVLRLLPETRQIVMVFGASDF
ncbi:MAG TPA: hypothetical protein VD867_13460, partial [Burkholderiales bacterium]|nr:hypothetical protein [Burkholderiales bacterium]